MTDHYHQLGRPRVSVTAKVGDEIVARSDRVLMLKEVYHEKVLDPVYYFPLEDVQAKRFTPTATSTACPIKGDASYWTYVGGAGSEADLAWSYQQPIEYSKHIAGRVAFDPRRVTFEIAPLHRGTKA